jgi:glycosyltransferase involved in cell wall biosynthesis
MSKPDKPILSFISAVYNKSDVLQETLACLRSQEGLLPDQTEFIFVDDNSSDQSRALLEAEAAKDSRLTVIGNGDNRGPAARFNQAAKAAKGEYVLALDADDLLPANAASFLLKVAQDKQAQVVFGQSKRSLAPCAIAPDASILLPDDPLGFAAKKKIVRMGILAERSHWLEAGGADESLFIQDQSLPLRLSQHAKRIAYIEDYVYYLRPADESNLSANVMQQHHDRFFALQPFLKDPTLSDGARKAINKQLVSTLWKARRDNGKPLPHLSKAHWLYLLNKVNGRCLAQSELDATAHDMLAWPNIKRPIKG